MIVVAVRMGAQGGTVMTSGTRVSGVTTSPSAASVAATVMVSASVPAWNCTVGTTVEFAGTMTLKVLPPPANWMAGSLTVELPSALKVRVNVAVRSRCAQARVGAPAVPVPVIVKDCGAFKASFTLEIVTDRRPAAVGVNEICKEHVLESAARVAPARPVPLVRAKSVVLPAGVKLFFEGIVRGRLPMLLSVRVLSADVPTAVAGNGAVPEGRSPEFRCCRSQKSRRAQVVDRKEASWVKGSLAVRRVAPRYVLVLSKSTIR